MLQLPLNSYIQLILPSSRVLNFVILIENTDSQKLFIFIFFIFTENKAQNGMGSKELHRIPEWQQVTLSWSDVTVTTTARTNCKIRKETCSKTILNSGYIINLAVNNDILSIQIATPRIFSYCYDNHVAFFFFTVSGEVRPGKLVAIMGAR